MKRLGLLLMVTLAGCDLYFGDTDDPVPCPAWEYGDGAEPASRELRDPNTGICQQFGGGYPYPCDDRCGPCPADGYGAEDGGPTPTPPPGDGGGGEPGSSGSGSTGSGTALLEPIPDWGQCYGSCEYLDEQSCIATAGCVAAYEEWSPMADAPSTTSFKGCWEVPPSGPVRGEACWELDAQECSRHDDCAMFYGYDPAAFQESSMFTRCAPEPTKAGCEAVLCGPGTHCEEQCYPCDSVNGEACPPFCQPMCVPDSPLSCANVDCGPGYTCVEQCDATDPAADGMTFPGQCGPTCAPTGTNPGSCTGDVLCDRIPPACPGGTVPGIDAGCYTGYCIPVTACGPSDPGTCGEATCDQAPPACPAGTVPGIGASGCYTGYCIPDASCGPALCETLTTEDACTARGDCAPVYTGSDCTCTPAGCTCAALEFARCESWGMQPWPL